jgi:hypothetical protein
MGRRTPEPPEPPPEPGSLHASIVERLKEVREKARKEKERWLSKDGKRYLKKPRPLEEDTP